WFQSEVTAPIERSATVFYRLLADAQLWFASEGRHRDLDATSWGVLRRLLRDGSVIDEPRQPAAATRVGRLREAASGSTAVRTRAPSAGAPPGRAGREPRQEQREHPRRACVARQAAARPGGSQAPHGAEITKDRREKFSHLRFHPRQARQPGFSWCSTR